MKRHILIGILATLAPLFVAACATDHNEGGSQPINDVEAVEYQKSLLRCHKTGGTRIIKIEGQLRCF